MFKGEESPQTAPLLNTDLDIPNLIDCENDAPKNPPNAAVPVNALLNIKPNVPGGNLAYLTNMNSPPAK